MFTNTTKFSLIELQLITYKKKITGVWTTSTTQKRSFFNPSQELSSNVSGHYLIEQVCFLCENLTNQSMNFYE